MSIASNVINIRKVFSYLVLILFALCSFGTEIYYIVNSYSPLYNVQYVAVYDSEGKRYNLDAPIQVKPNDTLLINRLACSTKKIDATINKELIGPINNKLPPYVIELPSVDMQMGNGCQPMRAYFKIPPATATGEYTYFTSIKVTPVPLVTIRQALPQINIYVLNSNPAINTSLNTKLP